MSENIMVRMETKVKDNAMITMTVLLDFVLCMFVDEVLAY